MLPDPLDVYIDIETRRSPAGAPDFVKGYPDPLPFFELWQGEQDEAPRVRDHVEIKVGNRGPEKAEEYRQAEIAKDEAALIEWGKTAGERYNALQEARAAKVAELDEATSSDAFQGGEVGIIGLILGEEGKPRLIHPGNDPQLPAERRIEYLGTPAADVAKRLELHRIAEFRCLQRLSLGLQLAAWQGRSREAGDRSRQLRIHAWGGWDFDFQFMAVRASHLARFDPERNAFAHPHDDAPNLDRDLVWLTCRFWHDVPWKSEGLFDPRETWAFGKRSRFVRGRLVHVAEFYGYEVPAWYRAFRHGLVPDLLEAPGHPYRGPDQPQIVEWMQRDPRAEAITNLEVAELVCRLDVECLRFVHSSWMDLGVGR